MFSSGKRHAVSYAEDHNVNARVPLSQRLSTNEVATVKNTCVTICFPYSEPIITYGMEKELGFFLQRPFPHFAIQKPVAYALESVWQ